MGNYTTRSEREEKMKKLKIREKSFLWYIKEVATSLWTLVIIGIIALVIFGFSRTPITEEAAGMSEETEAAPELEKIYDVPLEPELQLYIKKLCDSYGVDMPLVLAIIGQESNYQYNIIGDDGDSIGLMQVQPQHHQSRMYRLGVTNLLEPKENVTVGIDILAELLREQDTEWAVTAYNAGKKAADFNKQVGVISEYAESVMTLAEEIRKNEA